MPILVISSNLLVQHFTHSRKPLILVLYKMHCPQKRLTSLIFNNIVSIGEGLIQLHDPATQLL